MGDPNEPGRISVTMKADSREGTWIVFHGSPAEVRDQIIDVFALTEEETDGPLYDLINEATRLYKAAGNVNSTLGGRVVGGTKSETTKSGSAWDRAAGNGGNAPAEPEVDPNVVRLTNAIEGATDVTTLKELYARNKAHFDGNAELFAAWQAKGKSLS